MGQIQSPYLSFQVSHILAVFPAFESWLLSGRAQAFLPTAPSPTETSLFGKFLFKARTLFKLISLIILSFSFSFFSFPLDEDSAGSGLINTENIGHGISFLSRRPQFCSVLRRCPRVGIVSGCGKARILDTFFF